MAPSKAIQNCHPCQSKDYRLIVNMETVAIWNIFPRDNWKHCEFRRSFQFYILLSYIAKLAMTTVVRQRVTQLTDTNEGLRIHKPPFLGRA